MKIQNADEFFEKIRRGEDHCLSLTELERLVKYEIKDKKKGTEYQNLRKAYDSHIRNDKCNHCKVYYEAINISLKESLNNGPI